MDAMQQIKPHVAAEARTSQSKVHTPAPKNRRDCNAIIAQGTRGYAQRAPCTHTPSATHDFHEKFTSRRCPTGVPFTLGKYHEKVDSLLRRALVSGVLPLLEERVGVLQLVHYVAGGAL